jgi:hypothetical protein
MVLSPTDFTVVPYNIVQSPDNANTLAAFIDAKEKEVIKELFGLTFFKSIESGFASLPPEWSAANSAIYDFGFDVVFGKDIYRSTIDNNADTPGTGITWTLQPVNKWLRLKKGDTYTYAGREQTWQGFPEALKPYIHSEWLRDSFSPTAALGSVVPQVENSLVINPGHVIARHYNKYAEIVRGTFELYVDAYIADLAYSYWSNWYHEDSLYGYLYANAADFDAEVNTQDFRTYLNDKFCAPGYLNVMNL